MEHFVTSRPELKSIVDIINKKIDQKGYCSMDDLIGNKDHIHGFVFPNQEEAYKFVDAFHVWFPNKDEEWNEF